MGRAVLWMSKYIFLCKSMRIMLKCSIIISTFVPQIFQSQNPQREFFLARHKKEKLLFFMPKNNISSQLVGNNNPALNKRCARSFAAPIYCQKCGHYLVQVVLL
jgi:hypothetical protein